VLNDVWSAAFVFDRAAERAPLLKYVTVVSYAPGRLSRWCPRGLGSVPFPAS
jgi:hypothetical protein